MATITIITKKQYEFCDDIKKHILSYLGAKPMKLVNLYNIPRCLLPPIGQSVKAKHIYQLRMLITKEQYDYGRSNGGKAHRRKDTLNRMYVSRKTNLIVEIKNYWIKQTNRLGGLDGVIRPLIDYPPNEYNSYISNYANPYHKLIHTDNFTDNKYKYLANIRTGAMYFQQRIEAKRQREAYESWLVEHEKKKAEDKAKAKAVKQAKSRERVPCSYCGKELARGSLSKHKKVGGKCYEEWKKPTTLY
jgi:hypothetical protein